jgi:hypothetical protein
MPPKAKLTYHFSGVLDFRYGRIFNEILGKNKRWALSGEVTQSVLSDKNNLSKVKMYIDGELRYMLKHNLAKNYSMYPYIPLTIVIENNNLPSLSSIRNGIWYLKPSHERVGAGKDITLLNSFSNLKELTKQYKNWVIQKEVDKPLLFNDHKFAVRFYAVLTYDKKMASLYTSTVCKINVCVKKYVSDSLDPLVQISHNEFETHDDKYIKYGTRDGIFDINGTKLDFDDMDILFGKMNFVTHDLIIKNSSYFSSDSDYGYRIYGFDFTFDTSLNAYLLEVNDGPLLQFGSQKMINIISKPLLSDVISCVENMYDYSNKIKTLTILTEFYIK